MVSLWAFHVVLVLQLELVRADWHLERSEIEKLVVRWAPLIWLAPDEKYLPLGVPEFLENIHITDRNGNQASRGLNVEISSIPDSKSLFLVTKTNLDVLKTNTSSFLYGRSPKNSSVPVYVLVTQCTPNKSFRTSTAKTIKNDITDTLLPKSEPNYYFHVTYWLFFPYNEGKEVCFLGKVPAPTIFGACLGRRKTMGNHVGDWEHMSISFQGKPVPYELYMAVHDAGVYYRYDPGKRIFKYESQITQKGIVQRPKFPPLVRTSGGHPIIFSAYGSHGLWSAPGEHNFVRVPQLTDKNGYGIPWKTWDKLDIYHLGTSKLPHWLNFKGHWGNPKSNCLLFSKLGICELTDGPVGILTRKQDFYCWNLR